MATKILMNRQYKFFIQTLKNISNLIFEIKFDDDGILLKDCEIDGETDKLVSKKTIDKYNGILDNFFDTFYSKYKNQYKGSMSEQDEMRELYVFFTEISRYTEEVVEPDVLCVSGIFLANVLLSRAG